MYGDSDNWFKASIEYENERFFHLGSVVTTHGYSDWATTEITPVSEMWYRLHRRGPDFLVENSVDGTVFKQMRIFHVHTLGETTVEMGKMDPSELAEYMEHAKCTEFTKHGESAKHGVRFGLYACSPQDSFFTARFGDFGFEDCLWKAHGE
jgi:regulation of enolase protein 1 (concanavalin A-like superfamily)